MNAQNKTEFCNGSFLANEELAGALVLKVVQKIDFGRVFSRATIVEGDALKKGVKLKNHASRKTDIFAEFDCDAYLRYYAICIKPEHRKKGLGRQLMRSAQSVARSCGVPVVMGMFSSRGLQQIALRLGMRVANEGRFGAPLQFLPVLVRP